MPENVATKLAALETEIDTVSEMQYAYDPQIIAHGGVFVMLNHDGIPRIECGFIRSLDDTLAVPERGSEP